MQFRRDFFFLMYLYDFFDCFCTSAAVLHHNSGLNCINIKPSN